MPVRFGGKVMKISGIAVIVVLAFCAAAAEEGAMAADVERNLIDLGAGNRGQAINESGQVAGYHSPQFPETSTWAFIYSGELTQVGKSGANAVAINDAGEVAGNTHRELPSIPCPYLYSGGVVTTIRELPGGEIFKSVRGMNNKGQMAGTCIEGWGWTCPPI
jgi:hypothetical protein